MPLIHTYIIMRLRDRTKRVTPDNGRLFLFTGGRERHECVVRTLYDHVGGGFVKTPENKLSEVEAAEIVSSRPDFTLDAQLGGETFS